MNQNLSSQDVMVLKCITKNNTRYDENLMIFTERIEGGKSVMVWKCLTSKGVGELVFNEKMLTK